MTETEEIKDNIIEGMKLLDEDRVIKYVNIAIIQQTPQSEILGWLTKGLYEVGKLYECEQYYIVELIVSETIYTSALMQPGFSLFETSAGENRKGVMVLGTVKDDHHDIGKNIFKRMAEADGFLVYDLGVDVPPEEFIRAIEKYKPDVVAISAILTSVVNEIKRLISLIRKTDTGKSPYILLGGTAIVEQIKDYVGADGCAENAEEGVKLLNKIIGEAD